MGAPELTELNLEVSADDATAEDIDWMTRDLLSMLREMDVEWVELKKGGPAPKRSKIGDVITTGAIVMAVVPAVLPKIVDGIQAWVMRGSNRTVKFEGKIAGQPVKFEGSAQDLQNLLATLQKASRKK